MNRIRTLGETLFVLLVRARTCCGCKSSRPRDGLFLLGYVGATVLSRKTAAGLRQAIMTSCEFKSKAKGDFLEDYKEL
jgi:hypothetical protein